MVDAINLRNMSYKWSNNLAYAVGLLVTDGNLSKDRRHLDLTSKDIEQLENFKNCLGLRNKITYKSSGFSKKRYPRLQFGNIELYRWLLKNGLTPNKTKTIGQLKIPNKYFFHFLRGHFDGDGCTYSYWDPRWRSSFMFYLQYSSASVTHINWLKNKIYILLGCDGRIKQNKGVYQLIFSKNNAKKIVNLMYKDKNCIFLSRKKDKIETALLEEIKCRDGETGKLATLRWWCFNKLAGSSPVPGTKLKIAIYTTKSFKSYFIISKDVKKINVDSNINEFIEQIKFANPDYIIGLGNTDTLSRLESSVINRFNNGLISQNGNKDYQLYLPKCDLPISKKPTTSSCNRLAYKVSENIEKNNLHIKHVFIHLNRKESIE